MTPCKSLVVRVAQLSHPPSDHPSVTCVLLRFVQATICENLTLRILHGKLGTED